MAKVQKEKLFDGRHGATIMTSRHGMWYFRIWLDTENKYLLRSLKTKNKAEAIIRGEEQFIEVRTMVLREVLWSVRHAYPGQVRTSVPKADRWTTTASTSQSTCTRPIALWSIRKAQRRCCAFLVVDALSLGRFIQMITATANY